MVNVNMSVHVSKVTTPTSRRPCQLLWPNGTTFCHHIANPIIQSRTLKIYVDVVTGMLSFVDVTRTFLCNQYVISIRYSDEFCVTWSRGVFQILPSVVSITAGVNENIYTFVALSWLCCLIIPFGMTFYCHGRTLWACRKSMYIFTVEGANHEDIYLTKVLAYASLATFLCEAPYFGVNLAAGLGVYIPRDAFFASIVLLFFSWSIPWLIFTLTSGVKSIAACCACSCACSCDDVASWPDAHVFDGGDTAEAE